MANQVKTTFTVDAAQALRTIKEYQGRLEAIAKLESQLGTRGPGRGASVSTSSGSAAKGVDAEMKAAQREIAKMEKERAREAREASRAIERDAKLQAKIQKQEAKAAADAMIAELRRVEKERTSKKNGMFSNADGSLNIKSLLGGIGVGYAASQFISFMKDATDRTVALERANRLLSSAATEAGQSLSTLSTQNKEFAQQLGLTERDTAAVTAKIAQLAVNSGDASRERISQLTKAFANLGAARGIEPGMMRDLIGTILSGQDEGLNRLGISDPGQLQAAYAKSIGKTTDQLTQQEKVTAAVNAVLEKAAKFTGAAEARQKSFEGQIARSAAAIERFRDAMAQVVVGGPAFATAIETITRNLPGATGENFQQKLREGRATPAEIEAAARRSDLSLFGNAGGRRFDPLNALALLMANLRGDQQGVADASAYYFPESRLELLRSQLYQQNNAGKLQEAQAAQVSDEDRQKRFQQEVKSSMDAWMAQVAAQRKAAEEAARAEQERLQRIKESMREIRSLITGFAGQSNPFVAVFENAYQALVKIRELTKDLGANVRSAAMGSAMQANYASLLSARMQGRMQASTLGQEASDFRTGNTPSNVLEQIQLRALQLYPGTDEASRTAREQYIVGRQREFSQSRLNTQLSSIGAFESNQVGLNWYEIRPTAALLPDATPKALKEAQTDYDRRFNAAFARYRERQSMADIEQRAVDQAVIQLTQGLNPADLTSQQREIAAAAREREADRLRRQEDEARKLFQNLNGILSADGIKVLLGDGEQVVRIVNDAPDSATVTRRPNASNTNARYGN